MFDTEKSGRASQSRNFKSFHRVVIGSVEPKGEFLSFLSRDVEPARVRDRRILWAGGRQETFMNHSIYSADRTTHLKIVVVALIAGIVVAGFSISMRNTSDEGFT